MQILPHTSNENEYLLPHSVGRYGHYLLISYSGSDGSLQVCDPRTGIFWHRGKRQADHAGAHPPADSRRLQHGDPGPSTRNLIPRRASVRSITCRPPAVPRQSRWWMPITTRPRWRTLMRSRRPSTLPTETSKIATSTIQQEFSRSSTPSGRHARSLGGAYIESWNLEAALDIEWAHAMAPSAKIYLIEANSDSLMDLETAVRVAASRAHW